MILKPIFENDSLINVIKKITGKINLIQNVNYTQTFNQKKVLISYSIDSFKYSLEGVNYHTYMFEIQEMCKYFINNNFCIDIVNANELLAIPLIEKKKYDIIIGFGDVFNKLVKLNSEAISILYMTEHHPDFSIKAEKERILYYKERHHKTIAINRSGKFYKSEHFDLLYDHIIVLGESFPYKAQYSKINELYPTGIINNNYVFKSKKLTEAKNHYLWLGSNGAIHKGLDILIDVFKNIDDSFLHICGLSKTDRKYQKIPHCKNIIDHGKIDIMSDSFLDIANQCAFIILPSCSEGFSTSITTGMLHGLIPIVTINTGFNRLNDLAFFLQDYHVEYISKEIEKYSNLSTEMLYLKSCNVYNFARKEFVIYSYVKNITKILDSILKNKL